MLTGLTCSYTTLTKCTKGVICTERTGGICSTSHLAAPLGMFPVCHWWFGCLHDENMSVHMTFQYRALDEVTSILHMYPNGESWRLRINKKLYMEDGQSECGL